LISEDIKKEILKLRKESKLCALKIGWELEEKGIFVGSRTIGNVLKRENLVRKYRKKKIKYRYIKSQLQPGDLIEIDVKYVPGRLKGNRYYQYTAIDCSTRWRWLRIFEEQSSYHSILFLKEVIAKFPYQIKSIKTDNGAVFTNYYIGRNRRSDVKRLHPLDDFCFENNIVHYLIDPGKPAQNGKVERSHRSDQEMFYDRVKYDNVDELEYNIRLWNMYYNDLRHCGLDGKTPNEVLMNYQFRKPPNVLS
jgi:transposase InsO family protein